MNRTRLSKNRIDELMREATADCHDEEEQVMVLFAMIEDNLQLPFKTKVLGMQVEVVNIALKSREQIVAICKRDRVTQPILLSDLPVPSPAPEGTEWIEVYRHWLSFY